jgi:hypothetical protein
MILSCITSESPEPHAIRVPFDPPIDFFEELELRLNAMRLDAEEDIGMVLTLIICFIPLRPILSE